MTRVWSGFRELWPWALKNLLNIPFQLMSRFRRDGGQGTAEDTGDLGSGPGLAEGKVGS